MIIITSFTNRSFAPTASTAQRDQFADRPNDFISEKCRTFAGLCDRIVQDIHDSLSIQPASLDVALIKKRSNEELGMHIHSSYSGRSLFINDLEKF